MEKMDPSRKQEWASGGPASLYLVGALHLGIFAFATKRVDSESAPYLGLWILGCAVALLVLGVIDLRRGDALFGTIGVVFGGLLGLGGGMSFVRGFWEQGVLAIDGWWFLSAGLILIMLLPAIYKVSRIMMGGIFLIGAALIILGLGMMGVMGSPDTPMTIAGWMVLFFTIFCWYAATAQLLSTIYGKPVLPL